MEKYHRSHLANTDDKQSSKEMSPSTSFPTEFKDDEINFALKYYKNVYMYRKGETPELRRNRIAKERYKIRKFSNKKIHGTLISEDQVPLMESSINILGCESKKAKTNMASTSSSTSVSRSQVQHKPENSMMSNVLNLLTSDTTGLEIKNEPVEYLEGEYVDKDFFYEDLAFNFQESKDSDMTILQDILASSSAEITSVSTLLKEQNDLTPDFNVKIKEEPLDTPNSEAMDFEDNKESAILVAQQILKKEVNIIKDINTVADTPTLPHEDLSKVKIKLEEDVADQIEAPEIVKNDFAEKEANVKKVTTEIELDKEIRTNIHSDVSSENWKNVNIKKIKTYLRNKVNNDTQQCDICREMFSNSDALKKHQEENHKEIQHIKCSLCPFIGETEHGLTVHNYSHRKCVYACRVCKFVTTILKNFKFHQMSHKRKRQFSCDRCQYMTEDYEEFNKHKLEHLNNYEYSCTQCDYKARLKHHLEGHELIHLPRKIWKCEVCDYSGLLFRYLRVHMKVHTNNPLFQCNKCTYCTTYKKRMAEHKESNCELHSNM